MFVHDFVHVARSFEEIAAAVLAGDACWLAPLATAADGTVSMRVGTHGLPQRDVRAEVGVPERRGDHLTVAIRWEPVGAPRLFPILDAYLEVSPLGDDHSRIALSGHYTPPFGRVGRVIDDLVLHALAEDTLRRFLHCLAATLEGGATQRAS